MNIFIVFAWEFCIENCGDSWLIFSGLRFPRNEARKLLKKFGAKFGAKFGTIIRKIRETFVLQLFWPNDSPESVNRFARIGPSKSLKLKGFLQRKYGIRSPTGGGLQLVQFVDSVTVSPRFSWFSLSFERKKVKDCDHVSPRQNTKPLRSPKMHRKIHPKSSSKPEIQKKYEKYTKLGD